jgi:(p)ppGpp synthase/HD superfamily hydrolase
MEFEIYFGSVEEEFEKKIHSFLVISDESENNFKRIAKSKLSSENFAEVETALEFSRNIKSLDQNHQSSTSYFIHALRVATHIAGTMKDGDMDCIKTGLIHNVFEISGFDKDVLLRNNFSNFTINAIDLTTINRDHQFDDSYLEQYYQKMQDFDERLVLIRCLDKLDNLLGMEVIADENLKKNWLRTLQKFIIPMAYSLSYELGEFIQSAHDLAIKRGCNEVLRNEYENLLKVLP